MVSGIEADCLQLLGSLPWPGNVRQLRNVIERAVIVTRGPMISIADLSQELTLGSHPRTQSAIESAGNLAAGPSEECPVNGLQASGPQIYVGMSLNAVKRELLLETLKFTGGNKAKAAEILGVSLKTLYNYLKEN